MARSRLTEDALRTVFRRDLDRVRQRNALGVATLRFGAAAMWIVQAVVSMRMGPRPDFEAKLPWIVAYAAGGLAGLLGSIFSRPFRTLSWYALPLLDMPALIAIQWQGIRLSASPSATGVYATLYLSLILMGFALLESRAVSAAIAGLGGIALISALFAHAEVPTD